MIFVAAQTERIRIAPNVLNVPLRPPAVLAGAGASLGLLSGGRSDLGLCRRILGRDRVVGCTTAHGDAPKTLRERLSRCGAIALVNAGALSRGRAP